MIPLPTDLNDETALRVGLVGAGPWASSVHAPVLAAGPETTLTGVWARRPEAAQELAAAYGRVAYAEFEELLDACDAVAFAVPPAVQATLATQAAAAGKALLLEKPVADTPEAADALADAIEVADVGSLVAFSYRYPDATEAFVAAAREGDWIGARAAFFADSLLPGSRFACDWRLETGAILDTGPHMIDLLDAALGPVTTVSADRNADWVTVVLEHEGGATSTLNLCSKSPTPQLRAEIELFGPTGQLRLDLAEAIGAEFTQGLFRPGGDPSRVPAFMALRRRFVLAARNGGGDPLDVRRGAYVQRLVAEAQRQIDAG